MRVLILAGRALLLVLLLIELAAIGYIVLNPSPDLPSRAVGDLVWQLYSNGVPRIIANDTVVGFTLNVALFAPFGLLLGLIWPRVRWWVWGALAMSVSVGLELTQLLSLDKRVATLDDIVANTLGGVLGALSAATLLLTVRELRARQHRRVAA